MFVQCMYIIPGIPISLFTLPCYLVASSCIRPLATAVAAPLHPALSLASRLMLLMVAPLEYPFKFTYLKAKKIFFRNNVRQVHPNSKSAVALYLCPYSSVDVEVGLLSLCVFSLSLLILYVASRSCQS